MPTYNSEISWLKSAIESVLSQTYINWELCISDDASTNPDVREVILDFGQKDRRIKTIFNGSNSGISITSNKALTLAEGEFIGFLDHDDVLSSVALENVVSLLREKELDIIYTDEDKLTLDGKHVEPFYKSSYSPDLFMVMNYFNHFTVIRYSLIKKVNGFRNDFDGSQDYDLLLRILDYTDRVGHVPKILYHWRKVPGSTASNLSAKPYAIKSQFDALSDTLKRRGIPGVVMMSSSGRFHIQYNLRNPCLISIVIVFSDCEFRNVCNCISSIIEKSQYNNFEIIVICQHINSEQFYKISRIDKRVRIVLTALDYNETVFKNIGVDHATGEYVLFLNHNLIMKSETTLIEMLTYCQLPHIGVVGALISNLDEENQYGGVIITDFIRKNSKPVFMISEIDMNLEFRFFPKEIRNCSAVIGALLISKILFHEVGGFNPNYRNVFSEVDLCFKVHLKHRYIVWNPSAMFCFKNLLFDNLTEEDYGDFYVVWNNIINSEDQNYNIKNTKIIKLRNEILSLRKVVIFGADISGKRCLKYLQNHGIEVFFFIDNSLEKQGVTIMNTPVYPPEYLMNHINIIDGVIIASKVHFKKMKEQLLFMNFNKLIFDAFY